MIMNDSLCNKLPYSSVVVATVTFFNGNKYEDVKIVRHSNDFFWMYVSTRHAKKKNPEAKIIRKLVKLMVI